MASNSADRLVVRMPGISPAKRFASRTLCASFMVVLVMLDMTPVSAQGVFNNNAAAREDDLFLLAPRALARLLREGEQAIAEKRYSEGITALVSLLSDASQENADDDLLGQDYFIEAAKPGYFVKSIKSEAIRLLSALPEEGRRSLEIQFGVTARQELDAAVAAKDFEAISDVARKYAHTEAGYDALILLAQYKLTAGYPLASASILQMMLEYPAARDRYGVQLASAAAMAMLQADRKEIAVGIMRRAEKDFADAEVSVAGRSIKMAPAPIGLTSSTNSTTTAH